MRSVTDDIWVLDEPLHTMFGLRLGARMTVVRLPSGGLFIHSPIPITDERRDAVTGLGDVEHIVAPNYYHHLHVGPWAEAFGDAQVHGVRGLAKKRPDLKFDRELTDTVFEGWADVFDQTSMPSMLREIVFLHRPSGTVIGCDLFENFSEADHWPTRAYLKVAGIYQQPGVSRMIRPMYRDRAAARAQLDHILAWDFDRVVIAHGDVVESGGRETLLAAHDWL